MEIWGQARGRQALHLILSSIPTLTNYSSYTIWIIKLCAQNSKWGSKHSLTYRQPVRVKPACLTQSCDLFHPRCKLHQSPSLLNSSWIHVSMKFCNSFHLMEHWFSYLLKQSGSKNSIHREGKDMYSGNTTASFSLCAYSWFKPGSLYGTHKKNPFIFSYCILC